jgi:hypothetical protein
MVPAVTEVWLSERNAFVSPGFGFAPPGLGLGRSHRASAALRGTGAGNPAPKRCSNSLSEGGRSAIFANSGESKNAKVLALH